jgi:hypothetical protein
MGFLLPTSSPPAAETPTAPVPRSELNDYFDRLDVAFSNLSSNAPAQSPPATPTADPAPVAGDTEIDWFGTENSERGTAEPWDLPAPPSDTQPVDIPLSYASPQPEASFVATGSVAASELAPFEPEFEPAPPEAGADLAPFEANPAPAAPVAVPPTAWPALSLPLPNPPPLPALADAFAALLAAEQGEPHPSTTGIWPASLAPTAAVRDELVDDVTRRVLDRLSDTVVREAVADIASKVAERLIREEIERIKASIK